MTLLSFLKRFVRAESGLAAVEFALVVPVMLLSLIGAVQVSNDMLADRKATQTASTLADLVSQETKVTDADIQNVFDSATPVMYPIATGNLRMRVTSIVADGNGNTTVGWSDARNWSAYSKGATMSVPTGLVSPYGSVIFTEIQIVYPSELGSMIVGVAATRYAAPIDSTLSTSVLVSQSFYLKPRRALQVARTPT